MNILQTLSRCVWLMIFVISSMMAIVVEAQNGKKREGVQVVPNEAARRVDVMVDGQPFTSYIYPETLKKPVLYPLRTAKGTAVTRGYPLDPRPGERVDHPHHVGLWFNYGDVNGIDFWNNSDAIPAAERNKFGTIMHRRVVRTKDGREQGELEVEMDWMMPDGKKILRENTKFIFHGGADMRAVDRITTLTALDSAVTFKDNKEGTLGLRVARGLEHPSKEPLIYTDASGKPTTVKALDNTGVEGMYRSSEGKTGDDVWGTRGRWTMLTGKVEGEPVVLAMLDHPDNPGYPTYWHARGYGLFAANPLGQKALSNGKDELNLVLKPGESKTFRHRILILSGTPEPNKVEAQYQRFIAQAHTMR